MAERKQMNVILIRHTDFPEETVSLGAKLCYSKANIEDLKTKISEKDQSAFIQRLMNMGHESVLEHATFTFGIEGVSRALLAQITRHRVGVATAVLSMVSVYAWAVFDIGDRERLPEDQNGQGCVESVFS